MANIFNLPEISYESLFDLAGISPNDHDRRVRVTSDAQKFQAGMTAIFGDFETLGIPKGKSEVRKNPHYLNRNFLISRGLDCSKLGPAYKHWFCTFDLPNVGASADPNGPRRIIAVCENMADANGKFMSSVLGGKIVHLLYTKTHYGEEGKTPAFSYLNRPKVKTPSNAAATQA